MIEEWAHCYVCGKMRLAKNHIPNGITYHILEKDGHSTQVYAPEPDNPNFYVMGLCKECAPKEGKCPKCGQYTHGGPCKKEEEKERD